MNSKTTKEPRLDEKRRFVSPSDNADMGAAPKDRLEGIPGEPINNSNTYWLKEDVTPLISDSADTGAIPNWHDRHPRPGRGTES